MPSSKPPDKKPGRTPDLVSFGGLAIAIGGILGGLLLEGGKLQDVGQFTAALIVFGGTLGAVMVSTPWTILKGALRSLGEVCLEPDNHPAALIDEIIGYATKARKLGLVSLEQEALEIKDPFLRKAMNLAVDGTDMQELKTMMDLEIQLWESRALAEAKVYETAGGVSPTIGILGAVLGLIQVMKNLANVEEVGHGIAVAFVATVYGVGLANLVLIPAAGKIRARIQRQVEMRELMIDGVISIIEGLNPKLIRSKLEAYLDPSVPAKEAKKTKEKPAAAVSPAPAPARR